MLCVSYPASGALCSDGLIDALAAVRYELYSSRATATSTNCKLYGCKVTAAKFASVLQAASG